MYILRQTNLLKFGLITIGIIIALFCFYVIVGFLGIQYIMEPYKYGTFFAWVIILFGIFPNIILNFLKVSAVFFVMIIIMNLFEEIKFLQNSDSQIMLPVFLTLLNAPSIFFEILPFIILISAIFSFWLLYQELM